MTLSIPIAAMQTDASIGKTYLAILYICPILIYGLGFLSVLLARERGWPGHVESIISGLMIGFGAGLTLLSLRVLIPWYTDPSNGMLEPLFVALGLLIAATETTRRQFLERLQRESEKSSWRK